MKENQSRHASPVQAKSSEVDSKAAQTAQPPSFQLTAAPIQREAAKLTSPRFRGEPSLEKIITEGGELHQGDRGPHVTRIQEGLLSSGYPVKGGATGEYNFATKTAVIEFQRAHGLEVDGWVGKDTLQAMDQYLRLESGSNPLPAEEGSTEAQLDVLLAKGFTMTDEEAQQAKKLLFTLTGDDFRVVLKKLALNGTGLAMISRWGLTDMFEAAVQIKREVVIPITVLQPAADTTDADFKRANEIYNPIGIEVEKGDKVVLSEVTSKKILGNDNQLEEFETNKATAEEINLMRQNRVKGRITGYWVPEMPSSRGEALLKSDLLNMAADRSSVVVNEKSKAQDTFAHELGHVLGLDHHANANNLMASGSDRNIAGEGIDQLSKSEIETIRNSAFLEFGKAGIGQ
jgi:hypothetical protein